MWPYPGGLETLTLPSTLLPLPHYSAVALLLFLWGPTGLFGPAETLLLPLTAAVCYWLLHTLALWFSKKGRIPQDGPSFTYLSFILSDSELTKCGCECLKDMMWLVTQRSGSGWIETVSRVRRDLFEQQSPLRLMLVFTTSTCRCIRTPSCSLSVCAAATGEAVNLQKFLRDDIYRRGGCRRSAALRGLKQVLPREANMKMISLRFAEGEREQRNGRITHASAADRLSWSAVEWARATWHFWVIDWKVARWNTFDFTSCQLQCVCACVCMLQKSHLVSAYWWTRAQKLEGFHLHARLSCLEFRVKAQSFWEFTVVLVQMRSYSEIYQ